jgi:hypothetical protein
VPVWVTSEGQSLLYHELGDSHLVNILLLQRRAAWQRIQKEAGPDVLLDPCAWRLKKTSKWDGLIQELRSRGEPMTYFADVIEADEAPDEKKIRRVMDRWEKYQRTWDNSRPFNFKFKKGVHHLSEEEWLKKHEQG